MRAHTPSDKALSGPARKVGLSRDAVVEVFAQMFAGAGAGIAAFDERARYLAMNELLAEWSGLTTIAVLGRHPSELSLSVAEWIEQHVRRVFATSRAILDVDALRTSPSREPWCARTSFYPLCVDGLVVAVGAVVRDVTREMELQEQRRMLTATERAARQQAEVDSRLKDELLATVSHELRTPLNGLLGWTHLLRGGGLTADKQREAVLAIERNAAIQGRLIDDLLDVSSLLVGRLRLQAVPTDLGAIVEAALDSVLPTAQAKHIRVDWVRSPTPLVADPQRLQQAVSNLLSNAVKFTSEGGHVEVRMTRLERRVEFAVSDDGEGIDADFLPYVFDRFRQADATRSPSRGGLGLGLAITRHLVELHGGTVAAASAGVGEGATFTISMPC